MMTTIAMGEATTTLGETSLITLTHQDHHQAVGEVAAEAVEVAVGVAAEEADLVQTTVSKTSYPTGLAFQPLKQN